MRKWGMTYSVKEIFYTLQGEGAQAGRAAVFCRFSGCNLWSGREEDRSAAVCRFCDTDFVGTDGTDGIDTTDATDGTDATDPTEVIEPTVDNPDADSLLTTNTAATASVSGTGAPGSHVEVVMSICGGDYGEDGDISPRIQVVQQSQ